MKTITRRVFAGLLALQLVANIFVASAPVLAEKPATIKNSNIINVYANKKKISNAKVSPYKSGKGYLVSAKNFAKLLKVKYSYKKKVKLIVLKKNKTKLYLAINKKTAILNKKNIKLKVKTRLKSGIPMVDAVSVAKRFKYKYSKFFSDTQCLVVATKKKYLKNPIMAPSPEATTPSINPTATTIVNCTNTLPLGPTDSPAPTTTVKPTNTPTLEPTAKPTNTPTLEPTAKPTPIPGVNENDLVYSNNFNNGVAGTVWNGFSVVNDPTNPTNKVLSHTETNWASKLSGNLISNCDPNQTYTIQFKIYGDAAHVAISYGQSYELVTTRNSTDSKNGIVSMSEKYYPGLYVRPVANQWDTYVATFKGYTQYKLYIMTQCDNNVNGGTVLLDDIKIYKGDYFATPTPTKTPSSTPTVKPTVIPTTVPTFEVLYSRTFEDGSTQFTDFYGDIPAQSNVSNGANGSSKAVSLTAYWLTCRSFPNMTLQPNKTYDLSFYIKGNVYQVILILPDDTRHTICNYDAAPEITDWRKIEYSFSTGATIGSARDFEFRVLTGDGTIYIDEIVIGIKGTKTEYVTSAPSSKPTATAKPTSSTTAKPTNAPSAYPSISIDPNGGKEGTTYAYRTTGLPVCFINTNDKSDPVSKGVYEEGVMCIEETGAAGTRLLNPLKIKIAVRGNSTSGAPKKPYNIKFLDNPDGTKNKQKVLGMSSHHKWNLLANYYDKSLLRNAVALKFASQLDGLDYTPDFRFCEVVLNGQYVGNYMITEKVEIARDRVNISKDNGDGGYGYIIENDNRSPDFQFVAGGQTFKMAFKDPDSDDLAEDGNNTRLNYIKNDIEQTWKNIYASTTYNAVTKYIDIDSFVDYHIVQDFAMPVDGYFSSIEMYKNCEGDTKLHMGPVWDYDLAFGNSNPDKVSELCFKFTIYLNPVFSIADCRVKRTQRWNSTAKAIANSMVTYLDETATYIKKSAELNNKRWPLTKDSYYSGAIVHKSNDEEVAYFKSQLQERISFIDGRFNSGWY